MGTFMHDGTYNEVYKNAEKAYNEWLKYSPANNLDSPEKKDAYIRGYVHGYYEGIMAMVEEALVDQVNRLRVNE